MIRKLSLVISECDSVDIVTTVMVKQWLLDAVSNVATLEVL